MLVEGMRLFVRLRWHHHQKQSGQRGGFLLLEVLLGIVVFSVFLGAAGVTMLSGQQGTMMGGDRVRGSYAALRGLEAVRSIRHRGYSSVTAGQHGVRIGADNKWEFDGTSQVFSGGYLNSVYVTALSSNLSRITSGTQWTFWPVRSGMTSLSTDITNWVGTGSVNNWSSMTLQGSVTLTGTPDINRIAVKGNYAYLSAASNSRLYVIDISNLAAPTRVATSLSYGSETFGLAIRGNRLYVGTDSSTQEVAVYDLSSPASLTSANLVASYNIASSPLIHALAFNGSTLFVGMENSGSQAELWAFSTSSGGTLTALDSLEIGADVNDISIYGTGAYLATSDSSSELRVVNISSGANLSFATNGTYNFTSTEAGKSLFMSGTAALLGRARGTGIQEVVKINTKYGGGSPPGAAYYYEGSGAALDVDVDSTGCYGFISTQSVGKAVRVINFKNDTLPELTSYTSAYGPARAIYYDYIRDRLYVGTSTSFLIFQPTAGTGPCT